MGDISAQSKAEAFIEGFVDNGSRSTIIKAYPKGQSWAVQLPSPFIPNMTDKDYIAIVAVAMDIPSEDAEQLLIAKGVIAEKEEDEGFNDGVCMTCNCTFQDKRNVCCCSGSSREIKIGENWISLHTNAYCRKCCPKTFH